ncbi:hypothetical protein NEDG_00606 [Nematocida displodere]|uniref:Protein YIP n=1 Tax=Nematocida displodere TaxID=1805483 RepID=A0A177EBZ3_9MICR|nr:hypothetical protein NEDG_00606 [Nematocida displodere]
MAGEQETRTNLKYALLGYLPGDKPLLEDLGIDFSAIKRNSMKVFFSKEAQFSNDFVGPLLFLALFGLLMVIRGRVYFGYLYYLAIISSVFIYALTLLMTNAEIDLGVVTILGYAFIPVLIFSFTTIALPVSKGLKIALGMLFAFWSTYISATEVTSRYNLQNKFLLLAYPMVLVYICFIIISIV